MCSSGLGVAHADVSRTGRHSDGDDSGVQLFTPKHRSVYMRPNNVVPRQRQAAKTDCEKTLAAPGIA